MLWYGVCIPSPFPHLILFGADVDECALNSSGCEQLCTNKVGGFQCNCSSGYELDEGGALCVSQGTRIVCDT